MDMNPPRFLFTENQTPFIAVERITFYRYARVCEVPFRTIFPNLKRVDFDEIAWKGFNLISIPSVKHLFIRASKSIRSMGLNVENEIRELLKLNPQIEDLELLTNHNLSEIIYQDLNENLPMLKRFVLQLSTKDIVQRYHLNNVIDFDISPTLEQKLSNIPFTFSKLERFKCFCLYNDTIPSCVFDFIAENRHLKSIAIDGVCGGIDRLFQLDSVLTDIEELSIKSFERTFDSDLIVNLFSQSRSLKKLTMIIGQDAFKCINDSLKSKIVKKEIIHNGLKLTFHPKN